MSLRKARERGFFDLKPTAEPATDSRRADMAICFDFYGPPEIIFGAGTTVRLAEVISRYGRSVLLVTGAASFQSTEQWECLGHACSESKIALEHAVCGAEPSPQFVDDIKDKYRNHHIDVVLGIGGGSVLDGAKAISAMLGKEESVTEYLEGVGSKIPDGSRTILSRWRTKS